MASDLVTCPTRLACITAALTLDPVWRSAAAGDEECERLRHAAADWLACTEEEREHLNALAAPVNAAAAELAAAYRAEHPPYPLPDARRRARSTRTGPPDLGPEMWRYIPSEKAAGGPWACHWCGREVASDYSHRRHVESVERAHMWCPGQRTKKSRADGDFYVVLGSRCRLAWGPYFWEQAQAAAELLPQCEEWR